MAKKKIEEAPTQEPVEPLVVEAPTEVKTPFLDNLKSSEIKVSARSKPNGPAQVQICVPKKSRKLWGLSGDQLKLGMVEKLGQLKLKDGTVIEAGDVKIVPRTTEIEALAYQGIIVIYKGFVGQKS